LQPERAHFPLFPDVCSLPINRGTGKRVFALRYAYNSAKGVCEPFMYSLKGGNKNNFYTKELCERACGTATPTPTPSTPDYGDICSLPLERGTGREEYVTRYGYDSSKGKCVSFPYSLKGGNANNFYSMALCEQICGTGPIITPETTTTTTPTTPVSRERCSLPIERGPCESYVPRFAYDSNTQSCVLFYYGGCLGNDNRFRTLRGCQYTCMYGQQTTMPTESMDTAITTAYSSYTLAVMGMPTTSKHLTNADEPADGTPTTPAETR
ncbi:Kunitz/Bovine pancreatic trypsin inhibitor domain protein, partial [Oesophagostomum dentatum]